MVRVARDRVVVLTFDPPPLREHWLVRYVPGLYDAHVEMLGSIEETLDALPGATVEPVPMPRLCTDAFWCALWDRPQLHLDPNVRRASSGWHSVDPEEAERGLAALRADLESGAWDERWGHLREAREFDVGLRLVTARLFRLPDGALMNQESDSGGIKPKGKYKGCDSSRDLHESAVGRFGIDG